MVPVHVARAKRYRPRFVFAVLPAISLLFGLLLLPPTPDDTAYLAALNDKDQLLRQIPGPRLLLVGGSNLTFGVDSVYLQKQLGIPVLNQSLCLPIGLRFMLRHVSSQIHPGDIVVVSPEYSNFGELQNGSTELSEMLWTFPRGLQFLSLENVPALFLSVTGILQHKLSFWQKFGFQPSGEDSIYRRNGFNGHGDLVTHLHKQNYKILSKDFKCKFLSTSPDDWAETVSLLADFNRFCAEHHARVLLSYPPIPESSYDNDSKKTIEQLSVVLREQAGMNFLSELAQSVYPNSEFFMTLYHLTARGRAERTSRFVQQLKPYITDKTLKSATSARQNTGIFEANRSLVKETLPSKRDIVNGLYRMGLGSGWYPLEHAGADNFRWASNDTEIWLPLWHHPLNNFAVNLEIEPGPCLGKKHCLLRVLDDKGDVLAQSVVDGRKKIKLKLPENTYGDVIRLHVDSDNQKLKDEPRILNFRVFDISVGKID